MLSLDLNLTVCSESAGRRVHCSAAFQFSCAAPSDVSPHTCVGAPSGLPLVSSMRDLRHLVK